MKKRNILSFLLAAVLMISCASCAVGIDEEDKKDLVNIHIKENFVVDSSISYIFFELKMMNSSIDSDDAIKNVEEIQNWLNLNSEIEVIGIVGTLEVNNQKGCYLLYRESDKSYNYNVYLSKSHFLAKSFNAACYIDVQNGDDYFLIICNSDDTSNSSENNEEVNSLETSDSIDEVVTEPTESLESIEDSENSEENVE